jgi:hypothetical protein
MIVYQKKRYVQCLALPSDYTFISHDRKKDPSSFFKKIDVKNKIWWNRQKNEHMMATKK